MITGIQAAIEAERAGHTEPPILYEHEDCQRFVKNTSCGRAGGEIDEYAKANDMYRNACSDLPLDHCQTEPPVWCFSLSRMTAGNPRSTRADGLGNAFAYRMVHWAACIRWCTPAPRVGRSPRLRLQTVGRTRGI